MRMVGLIQQQHVEVTMSTKPNTLIWCHNNFGKMIVWRLLFAQYASNLLHHHHPNSTVNKNNNHLILFTLKGYTKCRSSFISLGSSEWNSTVPFVCVICLMVKWVGWMYVRVSISLNNLWHSFDILAYETYVAPNELIFSNSLLKLWNIS